MTFEPGRQFTHGPFQCRVVGRCGNVVLVEGRIFATSPVAWFVGRVVEVPATWRRDVWPWRVEPAHDRLAVREMHQTEGQARQAFQMLSGGEP